MVIRIIAPAIVTFKLIDWHEFDGIDTQPLEIVKRVARPRMPTKSLSNNS
jgi:hypothetical protein